MWIHTQICDLVILLVAFYRVCFSPCRLQQGEEFAIMSSMDESKE